MLGTTKLPYGQIPVLVHNGELTLQTQSGKLVTIALDSHSYLFIDAIEGKSVKEVKIVKFFHYAPSKMVGSGLSCSNVTFMGLTVIE